MLVENSLRGANATFSIEFLWTLASKLRVATGEHLSVTLSRPGAELKIERGKARLILNVFSSEAFSRGRRSLEGSRIEWKK